MSGDFLLDIEDDERFDAEELQHGFHIEIDPEDDDAFERFVDEFIDALTDDYETDDTEEPFPA